MRASAADPASKAPPGLIRRLRLGEAAKGLVLAAVVAAPWIPSGAFHGTHAATRPGEARSLGALQNLLERRPADDPLRAFYAARDHRPLWVTGGAEGGPRPEAYEVLALVRAAARDGLDPGRYRPEALTVRLQAARGGAPAELARAEVAVSEAFAAYVVDLRTPPEPARLAFMDSELTLPAVGALAVLDAAARAPSLAAHVRAAARMNPVYEELRAALAEHRARSGGVATERLILANMDRARGLPRALGPRFILVNAASAELRVYEDGEEVDRMPVIVGRPSAATPPMAGVIRYARFRPYWNLPEGMVREEFAPRVLREGPGFLAAAGFEALSDWSPQARVLDPAEIDWRAVARGERSLRLRQSPGPGNILGNVKLMLPNHLGIYLHDTPDKASFRRSRRTLSAGCIRLADADRLTRRLLEWEEGERPPEGVNQRVDLPRGVPVYILYLTAERGEGGEVLRHPDLYGRDSQVIAARAGDQNLRT